MKRHHRWLDKGLSYGSKLLSIVLLALLAFGLAGTANAAITGEALSTVAQNITNSMGNLAKLITSASYVAGFGFALGAIFKFKAHKDNPTQIPIGTPIALLFIAAALIFLPSLYQTQGATIWGQSANAGSVGGMTTP